jgi:hypothetical protein
MERAFMQLPAALTSRGRLNVGKLILCLLHKPAFGAATEDLGQPNGHFRRYTALSVDQFRKCIPRDAKRHGCKCDGQT